MLTVGYASQVCSAYVLVTQRGLDYLLKNVVNSTCNGTPPFDHHFISGRCHRLIDLEQGAGWSTPRIAVKIGVRATWLSQLGCGSAIHERLLELFWLWMMLDLRLVYSLVRCSHNPCISFLQLSLALVSSREPPAFEMPLKLHMDKWTLQNSNLSALPIMQAHTIFPGNFTPTFISAFVAWILQEESHCIPF